MPAPTVEWCVDSKRPPKLTSAIEGGTKVQAYFRIKWADAFTFTNDVMGLGTVVGIGNPGSYGPWRYPPEPRLVALSCEVEPFALPGEGIPISGPNKGLGPGEFWEWASAAVTFGVWAPANQDTMLQFDPGNPITLCQQELEFSSQFISAGMGAYKWAGDSKPVNTQVGRPMVTSSLTLKFPHVPFIPFTKLKPFYNTVNSATVLGCDPETLLFEGAGTSQSAQSDGSQDKGVTLKFQWREVSWNQTLRPESGNFEEIRTASNKTLFAKADHRLIFS